MNNAIPSGPTGNEYIVVEHTPSKSTEPQGHTATKDSLPLPPTTTTTSLHLNPPASSLTSVNGAESEVGRALAWCTKPRLCLQLSETEAGGSQVHGHPHGEREGSLDYLSLSKKKRKREIRRDLKGPLQHPGVVFQLTASRGQSLLSLFDLGAS